MNELIEQQLRDRFAVGFMFGVLASLGMCLIVLALGVHFDKKQKL